MASFPSLPWKKHLVHAGPYTFHDDEPPSPKEARARVEPWLAALLQAEHLNLLVGSGFTLGLGYILGVKATGMDIPDLRPKFSASVRADAERSADGTGRGKANIEDYIRSMRRLVDGLSVMTACGGAVDAERKQIASSARLETAWRAELDRVLRDFLAGILRTEEDIGKKLREGTPDAIRTLRLLGSFLLTFGSRTATRERLHIFTANYDRMIEFGADVLGLRVLDRFVGTLRPVFHSSRLGVDLHYNPPGIRGEPRYLEGVVRLTKLHGSVDWSYETGPDGRPQVLRTGVPFGAQPTHPGLPSSPVESLMIYPNPAKDIETLDYPYADLFRDFAAACCQPNTVLATYGYGFGDDHINRVIRDMLTIPSTHLVLVSFDDASGRIPSFCDRVGRADQMTVLMGPEVGSLGPLVDTFLPKAAIDQTTWRMVDLLKQRHPPEAAASDGDVGEASDEHDR